MRSAYVIKIDLNTKLIFTDLEDNRVSINGLDNVTITVSWNSDIIESQTCSSTVLFLFFISQKVIESIKPTLKNLVDDSLLPHIEKIQSAHHVLNLQREEIDKQNTIIQTLQDKLDKVEEKVEEQEQYSRRTSLRFNNVRVPTNSNGDGCN
jgi:hypothetical protein